MTRITTSDHQSPAADEGRDEMIGIVPGAPATAAARLLALQQTAGNRAVAGLLARQATMDATAQSITADGARNLSDADLMAQLRRLDASAGQAHTDDERRTLEQNLQILDAERNRRVAQRQAEAAGGQVAPGASPVPRPPGIPSGEGVQLIPISVSPEVAARIPEGQIFELPHSQPAGPGAAAAVTPGASVAGGPVSHGLQTAGAASGGAIMAGNYQVTNYGFAPAGSDSFGIVAIPRTQPLIRGGAVNPQANPVIDLARPMDPWGHTAMYVRRGGRIEWVRGFGPDMSPGQLPGFIQQAPAVESGTASWPGVVENDASMFRSTMARTVEYPISPDLAAQIAGAHPEGPGGVGGSPTGYTARPATFAAQDPALVCTNTNCVGYAVRAGEQHLGGPIGRAGQGSIADVGAGGVRAPNTAGQGQLYGMLGDAQASQAAGRGTGLNVPPSATGEPVLGSMPQGLRYLKWGGRVFLVAGIVLGAAEIYSAPSEQRARTAVGVGGGFAGGFALGAAAGLVCGPGAIVCSVVLGLGLGIVGSVAGRALAEHFYDAAANIQAQPYTDELNRAAHGGVVCPNCHQPLDRQSGGGTHAPTSNLLGSVLAQTPGGALSGRESTMSNEELRILRQWLGEPEPAAAAH